jgi:hypothetical protein
MSAARRLVRALEASAIAAGCVVRATATEERPWSSATFVGARHAITVSGKPLAALAAWLSGLPDAGLSVPGHVVAELVIFRRDDGAEIEALTLEA